MFHLTGRILPALALLTLTALAPAQPVRIMPLGDSITFGSPDPTYGGYRHLLATLLADEGDTVVFVGSRKSGEGIPAGADNEGHPGWTVAQLKDGIDSNRWLETYRPDIILLDIGTNDLRAGGASTAPATLSALLDDILARLPNVHVVVAQIAPFRRGGDLEHLAFNTAVATVAASKGPRVSVVDMRRVLARDDYADGLHPNASGYDKMARAWEPAIRSILSGSPAAPVATTGRSGAVSAAPTPAPTAGATRAPRAVPGAPVLSFEPASTVKLEQLIGEQDKQRHEPTRSRTVSRFGIEGTDLGYSFEHAGRTYFLFGDTVGTQDHALDTIATTDASDPESGVRLDFLTAGRNQYLTIQPPGISMGAFEVPVSGISLGNQMYVVVSTNHSADRSTDRSVLTKFTLPASFRPLRTMSQLPDGRFIKMSLHLEPAPIAGLPPGGPYVLIWGTGVYRKSDAYLAIVPAADFESGKGTRYFVGLDGSGAPVWSEKEADSTPIVRNGTIGDLSVTWCADLGLWLMTYDSRPPAAAGVEFSYSRTPWGPWSEPQIIFNGARDGAGKFIHDPRAVPDDGLAGPAIGKGRADPRAIHGGAYAPYVVERWTRVQTSELTFYYVLSTWNPYVVVLMKSRVRIE